MKVITVWNGMRRVAITIGMLAFVSGCAVNPTAFTVEELTSFADDKRSRVTANQEPLKGPLDLYEAMARALKYNLDYKVELMEEALRSEELSLIELDMLPEFVANAAYADRNNERGSSSRSLLTGRESLEPSTSSEFSNVTADLTLSWDVLDFGLSYVRAKQASDEVMIALERRRRVANRVIEDVRTAYWRAVSSQRLINELAGLEKEVEHAFKNSEDLASRRNTSPLTALTYQRELMDIKRELQTLHRELVLAKYQLASLINLPPGTDYELVVPPRDEQIVELPPMPEDLINVALKNRPELREVAYRIRSNAHEAEAAMLEMMPNVKGLLGLNYDSNKFLSNANWLSWGAQASWNLMRMFRYPERQNVINANETLLDRRALAVTMAIMTQAYVSRARHDHLQSELNTARRASTIQTTILSQIDAQYRAGTVSEQTFLRERMNTLVAEFRSDVAFSDLQGAFANIYASAGLDPYDRTIDGSESVPQLAAQLASLWQRREAEVRRGPTITPGVPGSPEAPRKTPTPKRPNGTEKLANVDYPRSARTDDARSYREEPTQGSMQKAAYRPASPSRDQPSLSGTYAIANDEPAPFRQPAAAERAAYDYVPERRTVANEPRPQPMSPQAVSVEYATERQPPPRPVSQHVSNAPPVGPVLDTKTPAGSSNNAPTTAPLQRSSQDLVRTPNKSLVRLPGFAKPRRAERSDNTILANHHDKKRNNEMDAEPVQPRFISRRGPVPGATATPSGIALGDAPTKVRRGIWQP